MPPRTPPPVCNFCGKNETGITWYGYAPVHCCRRCIEEVLPMMIADSLPLKPDLYHECDKEWNGRFKVRFLRALLARCQPRG